MTVNLAERIAEQASNQPDAPALVWEGEPISYGELQEMAADAKAELDAEGLPEDRPVGIRAKKSPEAIALIIACLAAEKSFLLPSIELAPETLAQLFGQAGASRVLTPHGPRSDSAASLRAIQDAAPEETPAGMWPPEGGGDDVSFMLTTSGSTGLPKIVPLTAAGVDAFTDWAADKFDIKPGMKVANYAPLNFDLCLLDIWTTLKHGGCVVMVDQDRATNASYLADLLADNEVGVVQAVPMLYRLLIDAAGEGDRDFPSMKHVLTTGDKIPPSTLSRLPALFPNARFFNIYGCTETNDSFVHEFEGLKEGGAPEVVPVGQPIPGVAIKIKTEDDEWLEGDAEGKGELLVSTPFQTRGYLNRELNADRFAPMSANGAGERAFYKTGDIVRRDANGVVSLEGRADFYVKVRGVRVSTQVVDQAIAEHRDVVEVVVVAVPDELAGSRLHAVVLLEPDSELNSLKLRVHCAERLARTEMPSKFELVTEPLPKTSTGKVDRKAVLKQIESG